nr:Bax inhibitor-1 family protein [Cardinium endosymbiont of Dermatophagoides farinae]
MGLIISSLVNIFFQSAPVYFVTSFIGVVVFTVFVAYNTQKLKHLYYEVQDTPLVEKAALMGAFSLYLNFLNLFLYLLRFLGEQKRRD